VQALLSQASTAFALGKAGEARALYQQVVRLDPREAAGWRGLGVAASQLGARCDAVLAFQRYLALRPRAPDAARVRQQLEALK
jgi:regulator of sirC expression with transglutaminase-like and TPR domain